jgi:hypothetical protein
MRDFKIEWNSEALSELHRALNLSLPVVIKEDLGAKAAVACASYRNAGRVCTIYMSRSMFAGTRLTYVKNDLLVSVLHEFRHAHQFDTWDPKRIEEGGNLLLGGSMLVHWNPAMEKDAEEWSKQQRDNWRHLFKIKPVVKSSFGKLSAAEARVRPRWDDSECTGSSWLA